MIAANGQRRLFWVRIFERLFAFFFLASIAVQPIRSCSDDRIPQLKSGLFALPYTAHRWTMFTKLPDLFVDPSAELSDGRIVPLHDVASWPAPGFEQTRVVTLFSFYDAADLAQFYCAAHPQFAALRLQPWRRFSGEHNYQRQALQRYDCRRQGFDP